MPIVINRILRKGYLRYFADPERFNIPSRNLNQFNVARDFFNNISHAKQSLESLLSGLLPFPELEISLDKETYAEFTVTGHAEEVRESPGQDPSVKLLAGQSGFMLKKGEKGTQKALEQNLHADKNCLVITSDLGRAIHHALLKYYPEMVEKLDKFADKIDQEIGSNNEISKHTHLRLVRLALKHGIIPTPLLRSHYHGERDLLPEKSEQFNISNFLDTNHGKRLYPWKTAEEKSKLEEYLKSFKYLAQHGRNPYQLIESEDGNVLTEDILLYSERVLHLLKLFSPENRFYSAIKQRRINFVGHSSNIDVISAYFRQFNQPNLDLVKAPKYKTRGKEIKIIVDPDFFYLNDPDDPLRIIVRDQIYSLRRRSPDLLVKEGKGIIKTPLLGFKKENEKFISYSQSLEDALSSKCPIIIFGDGGQGKSILAAEIARKFLEDEFGENYRNIIPIILDCKQLCELANQNEGNIGSLITESIDKLPINLRNKHKFAFILDDYHKVQNPNYTSEIENTTYRLKQEGNFVILMSRMERTDIHPPDNLGYKTMQIDREEIARQTNSFIQERVAPEHIESLREQLQDYDSSITGYYLIKLFLTQIFSRETDQKVVEFVTNKKIADKIKEEKQLSITQIYRAYTDYVIGCDILREESGLGIGSELRERIIQRKEQLAQKAYNMCVAK